MYKKYWAKKIPEGATIQPQGWRARPTPRACGPHGQRLMPIFCYMKGFALEKIRRKLSGQSAAVSRWNLGRSTFALWRSDSAGGTSLPEGEIVVIIITNNSPILGRAISINIFTAPAPLKP